RVGLAVQSGAVLAWALVANHIDWTVGRVAMIVSMVLAGAVIFCSVWVLMICVVFWAVEGRETANAFTYGGRALTQYPVDIYGRWIRRLLAYLVPLAFVSYLPALYVLGKDDPLGLPTWLRYCSPVAALGTAAASGAMWRTAVRHYRSAGG